MKYKNFKYSLPNFLLKHNISQRDFAKRIGVTEATVSRWVSGERDIRLTNLLRIAEEFDCTVDDVLSVV